MAGEQQDTGLNYASEGRTGTQALCWQKEEWLVTANTVLSHLDYGGSLGLRLTVLLSVCICSQPWQRGALWDRCATLMVLTKPEL